MSYTNELEDCGVKYTANGVETDIFALFHQYGANMVRLRLWHNPTWTRYANFDDVVRSARRVKSAGMSILLDLHYSDTWTDPEHNLVPAAWAQVVGDTVALADSVYNYTFGTLTAMLERDVLPAAVQIGYETNNNILVADNSQLLPLDTRRNVALFNAGIRAVNDFNRTHRTEVKTVLHVALSDAEVLNWIAGMKGSGIKRSEIFLTTKVWITNAGYAPAKASIARSLERLNTDYLDLLLVHQPFGDYYGTWRALCEAQEEGTVRAIGVSNFYPDRLVDLIKGSGVIPQVNQVETHVFFQQRKAHEIMVRLRVLHESWSPLARTRGDIFSHPVLIEVAKDVGRSVAQVALRFLIQEGIAVIPKSVRPQRMAENFAVEDFTLDDAAMARLRALDTDSTLFFDHRDPAFVEMLFGLKVE